MSRDGVIVIFILCKEMLEVINKVLIKEFGIDLRDFKLMYDG